AAPFLLPGPANRPEHIAPHHVGATWPQEQVASASVGLVERLVEVPRMELDAATAERTLEALVRARDVSVQRDRHVACSCVHVTSTAERRRIQRDATSSTALSSSSERRISPVRIAYIVGSMISSA